MTLVMSSSKKPKVLWLVLLLRRAQTLCSFFQICQKWCRHKHMQEDEIVPVNPGNGVTFVCRLPTRSQSPRKYVLLWKEEKSNISYFLQTHHISRSYLTRTSCFCLEEDRELSYIVFALRTKFAELKLVKGKNSWKTGFIYKEKWFNYIRITSTSNGNSPVYVR